ncbi:polysaccharide deacetylase family protein [Effusibacillus consociatus]|uniref:Polysaccharide deacetylase family protein n=1 Tax=Effusibacillus consociatus TaxID=1117041 RepID=A0ABV9QBF8_9BACL
MKYIYHLLLFLLIGGLVSACEPSAKAVEKKQGPVYYQDKVIVLMYHHIDPNESGITISPERFKSHLDALQQKGYNVISIEQYQQFLKTRAAIPPNAVVLTFDDGYESFYTHAFPELKKRSLPATNFIVVKSTDVVNPNILPHLSWDQMREMKKHGISFYNHTYDQHRVGQTSKTGEKNPLLANPLFLPGENRPESAGEYRARIKEDLSLAEKRLEEELGEQPKFLAFPYGAYNDQVIEVGKELGIELFFTIEEGINDRNQTLIYRLNAGRADLSANDLIAKIETYRTK